MYVDVEALVFLLKTNHYSTLLMSGAHVCYNRHIHLFTYIECIIWLTTVISLIQYMYIQN